MAQGFLSVVRSAIRRRLQRMARSIRSVDSGSIHCNVGVLFSGGIDSVFLSAVLGLCLMDMINETSQITVDLINVSFYDGSSLNPGSRSESTPSPDRLAAVSAVAELSYLFRNIKWNLVHVDVSSAERVDNESHIKELIYPANTHMDLNIGTAMWFASRGIGYLKPYSDMEISSLFTTTKDGRPLLRVGNDAAEASVGLSAKSMKRRERKDMNRLHCSNRDVSNCQLVSKSGCKWQLCKKCCIKKQREQSVAYPDNDIFDCSVHKLRTGNEVSQSIDPSSMVENLTPMATCSMNQSDVVPYKSKCRAYLLGIGADEQLAGYGRHRTVYQREGIVGLENELNMDLKRLWQRNLGRDDRCISDNGVEAWFPYLDEEVVAYIQGFSIDEICNLSEGQGVGDKRILRDAASLIGLSSNCSQLVKRAIQFGTGIAKQTNQFYHGSNRKGKGNLKI